MSSGSHIHPRPQLSVDELHQLRWLLGGVLTLLAVATVAYMDVEAWWMMAPTALVSIVTTLRPSLVARVPRLAHVLAFPVIVAFFAGDLWLRSELLPAMVRLDLMLLLYRATVYRQRRDDLQVVILGLFLVVVAGVLTVSLAFAVQILAYSACALVFLLVLTLVHGATAAGLPASTGAGERTIPAWAEGADWRRLFSKTLAAIDPRVAVLSAALFLGVIAASALLFLVIPRFELDNGMFLDRFISRKARTGFSDSIKFGDVTEIQQDTSVALHVDVSDAGQIPLTPYWRMLVLDEYENGAFRMSPALRLREFEHSRTGATVYGSPVRSRAVWTLYLESGVSRYLPLLGLFRQVKFAEAQTFQTARDLGLVALTKDPVTMTAYQVFGFDLSAPLRDVPGSMYLERVRNTPEARADAATLRRALQESGASEGKTTADFAARLSAWLRERHPYSLSPRIPDGDGDPLVRWAVSRSAGHCELFAGSFVLLARAGGYPARVVTGFRGGTWNAFSNSFSVRNSDAHAWAEIFDPPSGAWLRTDPLEVSANTAGADAAESAALARRTDRSWAARLDSLRLFWYRRVVSFDQQAQLHTLKAAKEGVQSALQRVRSRIEAGFADLKGWWHRPWSAGRYLTVASILVLAAALTLLWRRARMQFVQWLSRRSNGGRHDPIRIEAGRWLRRLETLPTRTPGISAVFADLQRLRFGNRKTWPESGSVFIQARRAWRRRRTSV